MSDSLIHAAAGSVGGAVAMTLTYPLIFISTRAAVATKREQKTTYQAIMDIIKSEGLQGIYSGLNSSLLGISVTNFVYYYFYEAGRTMILNSRQGSKGLSTRESLLNGCIAGSATALISNPLWVIQTQQATRTAVTSVTDELTPKPKKLSMIETAKAIINKHGIQALWSGIGPALILVINPVLQYTAFEQLKNLVVTRRTARLRASGSSAAAILTDLDYFLLGALSKLIATSITYPYIVVKSRLQAGSAQYRSAWEGISAIIKNEGFAGLYRGIGSKLVQSVLTAAILFASQKRIYEVTKKGLLAVNAVKA